MALGAAPALQMEQLDPQSMGALAVHYQKLTNSSKLGQEPLSDGPNKGPPPELGALLALRPMAVEGQPKNASSRGLGHATRAPRRAWCTG